MAGWNDFEKRSQVIAPPIYKPEVYRQGAENIARFTRDVDDAVSGAAGAAVGGVTGAFVGAGEANKNHGWGAFTDWGRFKDSMKTIGQGAVAGAKTGWNERNRLSHDIKTTAATVGNDLGVVPDSTMASLRMENNKKLLDSMRRDGISVPNNPPTDPVTGELLPLQGNEFADYNRYVNWSNGGKDFGRAALGTASVVAFPGRLASLPVAAMSAKEFQRGVNEGLRDGGPEQKRPEDVRPSGTSGPSYEPAGSSGWSMSQDTQSLIAHGLVGSLLGGLLGGKGGWWKWGLLGLLLGALRNGGQLQGLWNNIVGGKNGR